MTFDYTFGLDLPELKKLISTEQFVKSEELMDLVHQIRCNNWKLEDFYWAIKNKDKLS